MVNPFTWKSRLGPQTPVAASSSDWAHGTEHPFLFVGGLDDSHSYKQPENLLETVARLKERGIDVYLTLVGDGNRRPALEKMVSMMGCADTVTFAGRVSDQDLCRLYDEAYALIVPSSSDTEGFGLVIIEALSHGCPVIASEALPSTARYSHGHGVLSFGPAVSESLGERISELISRPSLREELVKGSRLVDFRSDNEAGLQTMVRLILGENSA
ncbi:MAG: glycosyltransferase [Thermoplasmata archaeon]